MRRKTFCKKFPPAPPSKTSNYCARSASIPFEAETQVCLVVTCALTLLALSRQAQKIIGVFGEGSGEAPFAKGPPRYDSCQTHVFGSIRSMPFMSGRSAGGMVTLPSAFWKFSNNGINILGDATAVLFRVWQY